MKQLYRVMMRVAPDGEWELWTNYPRLDDAELAAKGLLTSDIAVESEVIEVGESERRMLRCWLNDAGEVRIERKAGNQ